MSYCASIDALNNLKITGAYVANTCNYVVLSDLEMLQLQQVLAVQSQPLDTAELGAIWFFSFSVVIGLWLFSHKIGLILNLVKRA